MNKIINWNEVSLILTGNKNVIRANRTSKKHHKAIAELQRLCEKWLREFGSFDDESVMDEALPVKYVEPKKIEPTADVVDVPPTKNSVKASQKKAGVVAKPKKENIYFEIVSGTPFGTKVFMVNGLNNSVLSVDGIYYTKILIDGQMQFAKHIHSDSAIAHSLKYKTN